MRCLALLLCGTTNVLQLKPLWAMGKQSRGMGLGRRITMELPQLWVLMITAKEDGMSELLTSGDMSVNRKPECQAAATVEVRTLGRWYCPEQRGQEMTARARDLAACSVKKPETSTHPCVCSPARPPTLEYFAHNLSIQLPPISHLRTDACHARRRLPIPVLLRANMYSFLVGYTRHLSTSKVPHAP